MNRWIDHNGRQAALAWSGTPEELRYTFSRNGDAAAEQDASLVEVEPGIYSVLSGGRSYEVKIVPAAGGWAVDVNGRHFVLSVVDPREGGRRSLLAAQDGPIRLSVPMPGKIVRVLVSQGDEVAKGQGLIVVEAMKMQNELKAPRAGRIASLSAVPDASVTPGETLAILE